MSFTANCWPSTKNHDAVMGNTCLEKLFKNNGLRAFLLIHYECIC